MKKVFIQTDNQNIITGFNSVERSTWDGVEIPSNLIDITDIYTEGMELLYREYDSNTHTIGSTVFTPPQRILTKCSFAS